MSRTTDPVEPSTDPRRTDAEPTVAPLTDPPTPLGEEVPEETAEDTLADQVARTDAALVAWRAEAEKRRVAWQEAQSRAEAERVAYQRRLRRIAVAVALAMGAAGIGLGYGLRALMTPAPPATPPVPVPAPVVEVAPAPAAVVAPVAPPVAAEALAVAFEPGTARVWREGDHVWASFTTREAGTMSLVVLDGAGNRVLEPMGCKGPGADGLRTCSAGRSDSRITKAIAEGAAAGTWRYQACGPRGCADVGTFEAR